MPSPGPEWELIWFRPQEGSADRHQIGEMIRGDQRGLALLNFTPGMSKAFFDGVRGTQG
jgi:hypothetical protein